MNEWKGEEMRRMRAYSHIPLGGHVRMRIESDIEKGYGILLLFLLLWNNRFHFL